MRAAQQPGPANIAGHRARTAGGGVRHVSVFGSVARGEDTLGSDVDLALDLAPGAAPTGFQFVTYIDRLKRRLAAALSRDVDVVILPARRPELKDVLSREAIAAF
jgi:uncharacterized protein